ncbi:polysaccharide biosynthesis protein [Silanimonas lenta]|uniref:polysaccharide biosynthesis protein n=1 Tax=Silanimonas lenta TaxID=265429 RepID=UPI000405F2A4|nr:nucleoside-diphosphate sugar epimerase/dehydratase [Silanimonas lenta]
MRHWLARLSWSRLLVVLHDLVMVLAAWQGLLALRYLSVGAVLPAHGFLVETLLVAAVQLTVFWRMGLYRGLWRFASLPDLRNILMSSLLGGGVVALALFLFRDRAEGVPRLALVAYPFVLMLLLGAPRLLYRAWKDHQAQRSARGQRERLLILGAGPTAESLARDLMRSDGYRVVGFLDDDRSLQGAKIYGLPVLGRLNQLPRIAEEAAVSHVAIALPPGQSEALGRIAAQCERLKLRFSRVPTPEELLQEQWMHGGLKDVSIEDLLGREPVVPDWTAIRASLAGRTILVTGAGGSIGSELVRQCARLGAARLVLLERSEVALHELRLDLRARFPAVEAEYVLGDCADELLLRRLLAEWRPDEVFHAAAYKHVPLLEAHPREAIRNNFLVTETLARLVVEAGVGTLVLISTDKAVNPANMLGASKRLAELACLARCEGSATRLVTVRFGNVLDSAGSVVPLFREQIRRGGPVTVTHPDVTRYFMTIPEACQLILQATTLREASGVFTLDMGQPVRIRELAEQMIRLAGFAPYRDIAIQYTGLRPGEKLHEELFHADEPYTQTEHPKIFMAEPRPVDILQFEKTLKALRLAIQRDDELELRRLVGEAIPEFAQPQGRSSGSFRPQVISGGRTP